MLVPAAAPRRTINDSDFLGNLLWHPTTSAIGR